MCPQNRTAVLKGLRGGGGSLLGDLRRKTGRLPVSLDFGTSTSTPRKPYLGAAEIVEKLSCMGHRLSLIPGVSSFRKVLSDQR